MESEKIYPNLLSLPLLVQEGLMPENEARGWLDFYGNGRVIRWESLASQAVLQRNLDDFLSASLLCLAEQWDKQGERIRVRLFADMREFNDDESVSLFRAHFRDEFDHQLVDGKEYLHRLWSAIDGQHLKIGDLREYEQWLKEEVLDQYSAE